jgi:hypothetical protein
MFIESELGKRKAKDLASSGDLSESANRLPASDVESANYAVTGEQSATYWQQFVPPEEVLTYAAALVGTVAPLQPSGSLKLTAMGSYLSETAVSSETFNRLMSADMSGPLNDKPVGNTTYAEVTNVGLPVGERPNNTPYLFQ